MLQKKVKVFMLLALAGSLFAAVPSLGQAAGIRVFKKGNKQVKLGGRLQLQYYGKKGKSDSLFFRRLRPYIEGSVHKDWKGKFQWDLGKAEDGNELAVKDAYLQYQGFKTLKLTLGNANFPFSREKLTSSKKQQLVERTFVGDHNYGVPDRNVGMQASGEFIEGHKLTYALAFASSSIDPDSAKLDFDTPINKHKDFNEGWIVGGRIDFHPFGKLKFSQGDFKRDLKATFGLASFFWKNDGDNNKSIDNGKDTSNGKKPDVGSVTGLEFSGALRVMGLSLDAEYNLFNTDTIDGAVTEGLYENGSTSLKNFALEGGYMVIPKKLELVAGYQLQNADNYDQKWTRTSLGANWFFRKQDIKLQFAYRLGKNLKGEKGNNEDEFFLQMQYVF